MVYVIERFNAHLDALTMINLEAIIMPCSSGKTTLAKLTPDIYDVDGILSDTVHKKMDEMRPKPDASPLLWKPYNAYLQEEIRKSLAKIQAETPGEHTAYVVMHDRNMARGAGLDVALVAMPTETAFSTFLFRKNLGDTYDQYAHRNRAEVLKREKNIFYYNDVRELILKLNLASNQVTMTYGQLQLELDSSTALAVRVGHVIASDSARLVL